MAKKPKKPRPPYIDFLLSELEKQNSPVEQSYGRHVHWGYWPDPRKATGSDEDYGRAAENLTLELCRMAGIAEGERLLDAGCGFGGTVASLNERFNTLQMVGVNIDDRQLDRARRMIQPRAGNTVEFRQGDACDLPFPDASFDRVLAVECIFHFPSRKTFFKEVHRVLKPGGVLALSDFIPSRLILPLARAKMPAWVERYNFFGKYKLDYTVSRYREMANQIGLQSLEERNVTRNILPTYGYLSSLLARTPPEGGRSKTIEFLIRMQEPVGRLGLLNYYLLSFRKS